MIFHACNFFSNSQSFPRFPELNIPLTRSDMKHHTMTFQTPVVGTDIHKGSFFPGTITIEKFIHNL